MVFLQSVWWVLVLLGVMILIHELGHYWAARFFDVHVEAFSFGFGPRLFGFRKGETDFRFCAIPFGGYVKMAGEQPGDEPTSDPRSFLAKPRWQRLIVAASGPIMNILLAVALLTGLFMVQYPKRVNADGPATIGFLDANSPALKAGLKEGDQIVQIDDQVSPSWEDIAVKEIASAGKPLTVGIKRDQQRFSVSVTPELNERLGVGIAGWGGQNEVQVAGVIPDMDAAKQGIKEGDILQTIDGQVIRSVTKLHEVLKATNGAPVSIAYLRNGERRTVTVKPSFSTADAQGGKWMLGVQLKPIMVLTKLPLPQAFTESIRWNVRDAGLIFSFLRGLVERRMSAKSLQGPIQIAKMSGEAARAGAFDFILLMAGVSLNLAIFNLLPIPILDGGVILMLLIEMVMRRDLSLTVKEAVFKVGFVFLMMVVAFVLYNDISKILVG